MDNDRQKNRVALHEAIQEVLCGHPNTWMTATEIADEIAQQQLYFRRDGQTSPASQIHARINQYPHLFETDRHRYPMRFRLA